MLLTDTNHNHTTNNHNHNNGMQCCSLHGPYTGNNKLHIVQSGLTASVVAVGLVSASSTTINISHTVSLLQYGVTVVDCCCMKLDHTDGLFLLDSCTSHFQPEQ